MEYLYSSEYAALEQLVGRDVIALLCKAVEDVHRHNSDLDALFQEWVVRPLYVDALYERLLQEREFRESLNALRMELAQSILQAYEASPQEPLWRVSYWWWEIPEACDAPLRRFPEQWKLPERASGDILGSLLPAVDLHLREQVPLETTLSGKPLCFWGVKWSQLQALENALLLAVAYLDTRAYLLLKEDTEARPLLERIEQVNAHLSEATAHAFHLSIRPKVWYKPVAFGQSLLWVRYMSKILGERLATVSVEREWRELIRRKASHSDSLPTIKFLADFRELLDVVERLQSCYGRLLSARRLAPEYIARVVEQVYLRLRGWSWGQIGAKVKEKRDTVRKSTMYAARILEIPLGRGT
jgi:hypothetical protein